MSRASYPKVIKVIGSFGGKGKRKDHVCFGLDLLSESAPVGRVKRSIRRRHSNCIQNRLVFVSTHGTV